MNARTERLALIAFAIIALSASQAWALGVTLSQSKEELGLKYEVSVADHGTGRVTVNLTIADQGKLKPLQSVQLAVPGQDKTGYFDLVVSLATTNSEGKMMARAHLSKELAERATIGLVTRTFDGKQSKHGRTSYLHPIPIAEYIEAKEKGEGK